MYHPYYNYNTYSSPTNDKNMLVRRRRNPAKTSNINEKKIPQTNQMKKNNNNDHHHHDWDCVMKKCVVVESYTTCSCKYNDNNNTRSISSKL